MLRQYTSSTFSYPSSGTAAESLHANHSSIIPRPAAGQPILALERASVTSTCAGRNAEFGVVLSAGAKRRTEREWSVARSAAPESSALDRSIAGIVAVSAGGEV